MQPKPKKDGSFDNPSIRESAAGSLLAIGRIAIAEYCRKRGQDSTLLDQLHGEAVATWVATWGCDPKAVEEVVSNIYANLCDGTVNFDTTRPAPLMLVPGCSGQRH